MYSHLSTQKFDASPNDLKKGASGFANFLLAKRKSKKASYQFEFCRKGELAEFRNKYSSGDLQHQQSRWRLIII